MSQIVKKLIKGEHFKFNFNHFECTFNVDIFYDKIGITVPDGVVIYGVLNVNGVPEINNPDKDNPTWIESAENGMFSEQDWDMAKSNDCVIEQHITGCLYICYTDEDHCCPLDETKVIKSLQ